MTCSCTQTTTSGCSCTKTDTCSCTTETVINPLSIVPVTATDPADDKYSVETVIKASGSSGTQTSKYAGQITGVDAAEKVTNVHTTLTEIATDLIRGIIGVDYTGPYLPSGVFDGTLLYNNSAAGTGTDVAILDNVTAFQNYFLNAYASTAVQALIDALNLATPGSIVEVTGSVKIAKVQYIAQVLFQVYQSIQRHIEDAEATYVVCPTGSSRVIKIEIDNCLFCYTLIYN